VEIDDDGINSVGFRAEVSARPGLEPENPCDR
jgi:hypothetical protein